MGANDPNDVPVAAVLREAERDLHAAIRYKTTLERLLSGGAAEHRERAALALARVSTEYPEEVHGALGTAVDAIADDRRSVRGNASALVAMVAKTYPDDVARHSDSLVEALSDPHHTVVKNAVEALAYTTRSAPQGALDGRDRLAALLESTDSEVRRHAAIAVYNLADAYPDRVDRTVDRLATRLSTDTDEVTRIAAAGALSAIAREEPGAITPFVDDLEAILRTETDSRVRGNVIAILAELAERDPAAIAPLTETLTRSLSSSEHTTLVNATDVLGCLARSDPDLIREADAVPSLRDLWDRTDSREVRENVSAIVEAVSDQPADAERDRRSAAPADLPGAMVEEALRIAGESTRQVILDIETFINGRSEQNQTTVEVMDSAVGDLDVRGREEAKREPSDVRRREEAKREPSDVRRRDG
ncbi:hypothetical protein EXE46_07775 [Halorubrum sp. GN11_10-6_MGM]|uniref:HEAT repeat domain-containing protein n=1 Tax=Halorubrum sp. GN11_10-6_MGM TaxID=2518112 RepID=UPI0010F9EC31|nr:HEAT repeat domain-containing protein [Halorubrum sp. GN11_10-6_MGM]TKX74755.1 hypothetical protein EXE46_07775 [Halorubrum sp. GN11_10-6_MGM]